MLSKKEQVEQLMRHLDLASDRNKEWFIDHIVVIWEIAEHETEKRENEK